MGELGDRRIYIEYARDRSDGERERKGKRARGKYELRASGKMECLYFVLEI
jgi:hypothetical protein